MTGDERADELSRSIPNAAYLTGKCDTNKSKKNVYDLGFPNPSHHSLDVDIG